MQPVCGLAQHVDVSQALQVAIEDALAEKDTNLPRRLELVAEVNRLFGSSPVRFRSEVWLKAQFIEAVANMRLSQYELSLQQIQDLQEHLNEKDFPELSFRCRSLSAAIALLQGKRAESIKAFDALLAGNLHSIPKALVDRARTNYAAALNENGLMREAAVIYESLLLDALEHQNDRAALHAGNNLLSMLLQQEEVQAAKLVLAELEPIRERNPKLIGAQSILLREADILRLEDKNDLAIAKLQEFIKQADQATPVLLGSAHQLLALTYCQTGNLEQALIHAEQGVELTRPIALDFVDANLTLAHVQMRKGDLQESLSTINRIDTSSELTPVRQVLLGQLKLETQLRLDGKMQEADQLRSLFEQQEQYNQLRSKVISDYFESKLSSVHDRTKQRIAEQLARTQGETDRLNQLSRNLLLCLFAAVIVSVGMLGYLDSRRRREKARQAEGQARNEQLAALVERKTDELKTNLVAQAELAQALERKKRVEVIGLLASNVAHDINNLLQVIANANETLANQDIDDKTRRNVLSISNDSLKHGTGIIRQLLAYSRKQELTAQTIRIHDYLSEGRALFQSALGDSIELKINLGQEDCCVDVDPAQLTTSILNILSNAADAMPSGGSVNIQTGVVSITATELKDWSGLEPGRYLQISIVDTGCGMNTEQQTHAFEPFYSTKDTGKGTGLGLSSVHGFVRQSKGDVKLVSAPGVGTQVQILLPVVALKEAKTEQAASVSVSSLERRRILLVEDHKALATSLMTLLSHLKLQVTWVPSGDDAIKLLQGEPDFDFVLSDVHMPGSIDGLSLVNWIHLERPQIKALLMSGFHEIPFEEFKTPVLPKPFNLRQLAAFLTEYSS